MLRQILFLLSFCSLAAAGSIRVEPRILVKVGGTRISTMDVKKRMDFIFQHQYPQHVKDLGARYDFYKNSWQDVLRDMIQTEMILAHVQEREEKAKHKMISDGDVHREMHDRFGPDVVSNLSSIGMTYEEGCAMLRREMCVGNMLYIAVQDKVKKQIRPEDIRARYDHLVSSMRNKTKWRYQVITIASDSEKNRTDIAALAYKILAREGTASVAHLNEKTKTAAAIQLVGNEEQAPHFTLSVSEELETGIDDIDPERARILETLAKGSYSKPVVQTLRKSNQSVERIFILKDKVHTPPPAFTSCQERLKNEVAAELHQKEINNYLRQLEERFPVEILFDSEYQPFSL